ncbi:MAG: hypothetical protein QUV08_06280, partial [Parasphingorhabdus sp.]|nr:hypothetical protein [Parasphingorhabdus sp.]
TMRLGSNPSWRKAGGHVTLPEELFSGLTQHYLEGDQIVTRYVVPPILSSYTMIVNIIDKDEWEDKSE